MSLDQRQIEQLPKIELHLHLDCSLSFDAVQRLKPGISEAEYRQRFLPPPETSDLADILQYTAAPLALLQSEDGLREAVRDLFAQLQKDNVVYAEMRFAPLLHLEGGLGAEEVVEIVSDCAATGSHETGIGCGIILCTCRHFSEAQSLCTVRLVDRYLQDTKVCGFDIACDEAGFPIDAHRSAFEIAIQKEIPRTAHAGEALGAESVWETLEHFRPHRIGHGVHSIEDEALVAYLAEQEILLEVCPTSNIMIGAYPAYADHPVDPLYRAGVLVGINTDTRTLTPVTLTEEYVKLSRTFGWGAEEFYQCNLNALSHAFSGDSEKERLDEILSSGYGPAGLHSSIGT